RHTTPFGNIEGAAFLKLPGLFVRKVDLDRPRLRVHVEVQVVFAGHEQARTRTVRTLRTTLGAVVVEDLEEVPCPLASPLLAQHLTTAHGLGTRCFILP